MYKAFKTGTTTYIKLLFQNELRKKANSSNQDDEVIFFKYDVLTTNHTGIG